MISMSHDVLYRYVSYHGYLQRYVYNQRTGNETQLDADESIQNIVRAKDGSVLSDVYNRTMHFRTS